MPIVKAIMGRLEGRLNYSQHNLRYYICCGPLAGNLNNYSSWWRWNWSIPSWSYPSNCNRFIYSWFSSNSPISVRSGRAESYDLLTLSHAMNWPFQITLNASTVTNQAEPFASTWNRNISSYRCLAGSIGWCKCSFSSSRSTRLWFLAVFPTWTILQLRCRASDSIYNSFSATLRHHSFLGCIVYLWPSWR